MAVFSGKDGSLKFDSTAIARVRDWSMDASFDTLDITHLGEISRSYTAGLKSATGSATIFYHDDNTTLQGILDNCITTGVPAPGAIELNYGTKSLKFNCYVNSTSVACATGEVMTASIQFTRTGEYTSATL